MMRSGFSEPMNAFFEMPDNRIIRCNVETNKSLIAGQWSNMTTMDTIYYWNYGEEMCGINVKAIFEMNGNQIMGCTLYTMDGHPITHDVMNDGIKLNVCTGENNHKLVPLTRRKNSDRLYDFPNGTDFHLTPSTPNEADTIVYPTKNVGRVMTPDLLQIPACIPDFAVASSVKKNKLERQNPYKKLKNRSRKIRNRTERFLDEQKFERIIQEYGTASRTKSQFVTTTTNETPEITKVLKFALKEKLKNKKRRRKRKLTKRKVKEEAFKFELELNELNDVD